MTPVCIIVERKRCKVDHQYYDGKGRSVIFTERFLCAHSGKKRIQNQSAPGDRTRPRQEKSKNVDCPAKLEVKRYEEDPENVTLRFYGQHDFHDLRKVNYLPLENWVKILIKDRLEEGVDVPTIVDLVNDKQEKKKEESARLEHSPRLYRDVTYEDVYNQYYKIMVRQTRMAENDFSSFGLWLVELESKSYHTFLFGQSNPDTQVYNFGFGFIAPWQLELLKRARSFCLDATHHVTIYPNTVMYTIVLCHKVTGRGVPVAYLVTNDQSEEPVRKWLMDLKDLGVSPTQITVDCSKAEANAISSTWNRYVAIRLCAWHVVRAWQKNIKEKVVVGDGEDKRPVINAIFADIRDMMYEEDRVEFFNRLEKFRTDWENQDVFMAYFEQHKVHKRIIRRIKAEANQEGRMGPLALARRERQMKAEAYSLEQLDMMIELKEDGHQIQSFTDANIYYLVSSDNTFITSYTCADFSITQHACKHMYAIEIAEPELSVRLPHHSSITNVLDDDVDDSNLTQETTAITNAVTTDTPVLQETHSERI
ncbi:hypothetical protein INT45_005259 [Circinella minor]|uniref:SWIM-type domain-containing protein n=1 Tax=Circinella minor TaxID=1195481 RepID=A0A8H7VDH8_9FUNG|nr:hypothetical protein INT45_005259 [Circinella minor]